MKDKVEGSIPETRENWGQQRDHRQGLTVQLPKLPASFQCSRNGTQVVKAVKFASAEITNSFGEHGTCLDDDLQELCRRRR